MAFRFSERLFSFRHAFRGFGWLVRSQHNMWIHLVATVVVMALGWISNLGRWEWCALVFAIGGVWMAEAFNTAIECLGDEISLEKRDRIGRAKDVAATAVLITAIVSVIVGLIVFLPHWL